MTIIERALELVTDDSRVGLGSGHAAQAFVRALGERIRTGRLRVHGVPTSEETASLSRQEGIPLLTLAEAGILDLTVDGADEVDPQLNLIKGYGRDMVREKIVAASSRRLIILVGDEKLVPQLGTHGKLPVEVVPFALPLCERRLRRTRLRASSLLSRGRPVCDRQRQSHPRLPDPSDPGCDSAGNGHPCDSWRSRHRAVPGNGRHRFGWGPERFPVHRGETSRG